MFKSQLSTKVTHKFLNNMYRKTYSSGRNVKVGDKILFSYVCEDIKGTKDVKLTVVSLHKDELNKIYKEDLNSRDYNKDAQLPFLIKIK